MAAIRSNAGGQLLNQYLVARILAFDDDQSVHSSTLTTGMPFFLMWASAASNVSSLPAHAMSQMRIAEYQSAGRTVSAVWYLDGAGRRRV